MVKIKRDTVFRRIKGQNKENSTVNNILGLVDLVLSFSDKLEIYRDTAHSVKNAINYMTDDYSEYSTENILTARQELVKDRDTLIETAEARLKASSPETYTAINEYINQLKSQLE